jgi:hypothetical protein
MLADVPRLYVARRSELTEAIDAFRERGCYEHRTSPLYCECSHTANVRTSAAVVIDTNGKVCAYVIKCKECAKDAINRNNERR